MAGRISTSIARWVLSVAPDFERIEGRRGYWFRRPHPPLFSIVLIQHSTKYDCFGVDSADPQVALERIAGELRRYALPWFDRHRLEVATDSLVQFGLAKLMNANVDETTVDSLKWSLRDEAARISAPKWQRQETRILAADLVRMADERRRASTN